MLFPQWCQTCLLQCCFLCQDATREGLTKSTQVHLFRQMCEHACFVTLSATEIGLSVWAWLFEGLVTEIDCVQLCSGECLGVCPALRVWSSQFQILNFGGVLFPDPIRCCQSHKLNIYSVSLSPPVSLLVTLPFSNTSSTPALYFKAFFCFFLGAQVYPWSERDI